MWKLSGKSMKQLARELGVTPQRVNRAFRAWCEARKVKPDRFMVSRGPRKFRYDLPQKFVSDFSEAVRREKRIVLKAGPNGEPIRVAQ